MVYNEEVKDLFSVSEDYYLAHCISADFGMGRGIVVEFNKRFDMRDRLKFKYPAYIKAWHDGKCFGDCILEDRVLNLVTKECYYHKPTYYTLQLALEKMLEVCLANNIKKVAMPIIGCGLDRLDWKIVSGMVQKVFSHTDIEILVCKQ